MNRRDELKRQYKETPRSMGIFQIKNLTNGKIFIGSSLNLDKVINRNRFQLQLGGFPNKELQQDWNTLGESNFSFELIDELKPKEDDTEEKQVEDLKFLEEMWLEKLQPYVEKGYNKRKPL